MLRSDQRGISTVGLAVTLVVIGFIALGFVSMTTDVSEWRNDPGKIITDLENKVKNLFRADGFPCRAVRDFFENIRGQMNNASENFWIPVDNREEMENLFEPRFDPENYSNGGPELGEKPVSYSINPSNSEGLRRQSVVREIRYSFETWDSHTSVELFSENVSITSKSGFSHDGVNVVSFASLSEYDAVGMTKTWREDGKVSEFDIVLNTEFDWGIDP